MLKTLFKGPLAKAVGGLILALLIALVITAALYKAERSHSRKVEQRNAELSAQLDSLAATHKAGQERQKRELEAARRQSKADQPKIDRLRESAVKPDVEGPCEISETLKGSLPL